MYNYLGHLKRHRRTIGTIVEFVRPLSTVPIIDYNPHYNRPKPDMTELQDLFPTFKPKPPKPLMKSEMY